MANELLKWIIDASLLGCAASLVILLLRRPLRHFFGAHIAYQVWLIFPLSLLSYLLAHLLPYRTVLESIPVAAQPLVQFIHASAPVIESNESSRPFLLIFIWAAGCLGLAHWFWRQHRYFLRELGKIIAADVAGATGDIYQAENSHVGPALVGVWRAKIIVPSDFFLRYTQEEQQLILTHEKNHLARGDTYANILCAFAQCLFWFNPLIHLATRCFRIDQELACDATVIAQYPAARRCYAEAMLKTQIAVPQTVAGCHLQSHQPLKERIMQLHQASPSSAKKSFGSIVLSALLVLSAYSAWAASPASTSTSAPEAIGKGVTAQSGAANSSAKRFQVKTIIAVDGVQATPRTVSNEGEAADILIDGKTAKWEISYTLNSAKTSKGLDAIMLDVTVKKNGESVARPKLIVGLNTPAVIQQKNSEGKDDFEISLEPSIVN